MSVDEIVAELNEVAREALIGQLIFMPETGRHLCRLGLIELRRKLSRQYAQYGLTDLGRRVKAAVVELQEAEKALNRGGFSKRDFEELKKTLDSAPLRPGSVLMSQQDADDLKKWSEEHDREDLGP